MSIWYIYSLFQNWKINLDYLKFWVFIFYNLIPYNFLFQSDFIVDFWYRFYFNYINYVQFMDFLFEIIKNYFAVCMIFVNIGLEFQRVFRYFVFILASFLYYFIFVNKFFNFWFFQCHLRNFTQFLRHFFLLKYFHFIHLLKKHLEIDSFHLFSHYAY